MLTEINLESIIIQIKMLRRRHCYGVETTLRRRDVAE